MGCERFDGTRMIEMGMGHDDRRGPNARAEAPLGAVDDRVGGGGKPGVNSTQPARRQERHRRSH